MHRPILFNKTITMKKEELFEGAIVLARRYKDRKRTRCKIIEVRSTTYPLMNLSVVHQLDIGINYLVPTDDIRPAKITRKSLKECGFEDPIFKNCKGKCYLYTGTKVHLLLKDSACGNKIGNVLQVPWEHKQVRYMHEVQRWIKDWAKNNGTL